MKSATESSLLRHPTVRPSQLLPVPVLHRLGPCYSPSVPSFSLCGVPLSLLVPLEAGSQPVYGRQQGRTVGSKQWEKEQVWLFFIVVQLIHRLIQADISCTTTARLFFFSLLGQKC